jgi:hypothetical protein
MPQLAGDPGASGRGEEPVGLRDLSGFQGGVPGGGHAGMIAIHKVIASLVRRR